MTETPTMEVQDQMDEMLREINTPLHPDLEAAVIEHSALGRWIKHPFINGPTSFAASANARYEEKKKRLAEAIEERNVWTIVFSIYERPWRPQALLDYEHLIDDDEDYWHLVSQVWIDQELLWQHFEVFEELLDSDRPGREALMEDEEHAAWAEITDEVLTIYRGISQEEDVSGGIETDGFSWTTDHDRAVWFAKRFANEQSEPIVLVGEVQHSDVIAYFTRRNEHEVLVHPDHVRITHMEGLS